MYYAFLFLVSVGIIAITQNVVLIAIWVFLWVFASKYKTATKESGFLMFFIAFMLLWPVTAISFRGIHTHGVVFFLIMMSYFLRFGYHSIRQIRKYKVVNLLFWGWVIWCILGYFPIFYNSMGGNYSDASTVLISLHRETTMLKSVAPILGTAVVFLIPICGIKNEHDLMSFLNALTQGTLILLVLSLVRYIFEFDFFPQSYVKVRSMGFRMSGFSMPDPNGFGRMLLIPLLFLVAYAVKFPRLLKMYHLLTLFVGILCIILTFSRTTYFSFTFGVGIILILSLTNFRSYKFLLSLIVLLFLILWLSPVLSYFGPGSDRATTGTLVSRMYVWDRALIVLSISPWFGLHPGGWVGLLTINPEFAFGGAVQSAHSLYLQTAVEWGLPMFGLVLLSIILTILNGWRVVRRLKSMPEQSRGLVQGSAYAVVIVPLAFFVHGIAENIPHYFIFFVLGISVALRNLAQDILSHFQLGNSS